MTLDESFQPYSQLRNSPDGFTPQDLECEFKKILQQDALSYGNANIKEIEINPDESQHGGIFFEYISPRLSRFFWRGKESEAFENALKAYFCVKNSFSAFALHHAYGEINYCTINQAFVADMKLERGAVLGPLQKGQIAKGMEIQGYAVKIIDS